MTYVYSSRLFRSALQERIDKVPFTHISVHRIREGRDNLHHERCVVSAITKYHQASKYDRHPSMLVGCVPEDAHVRLRSIPDNIEWQYGYNIVGAFHMLPKLHGVAKSEVDEFSVWMKLKLKRLWAACAEARTELSGPIKQEYGRLCDGTSTLPKLCTYAADLADEFDDFCVKRDLLHPQP